MSRSPFKTSELFKLLCFEYKVVSVEHFLDEMDANECVWILRNLAYTDRNLWEATRLKMYSTASMFSKGDFKLQDMIRFPWEDGNKSDEPETPHMTEEQRKAMEQSILDMLNGNKEQ